MVKGLHSYSLSIRWGEIFRFSTARRPRPEGFVETSLETLPLPLTRKLLAADLAAYAKRQGSERIGNSTLYGPDRGLVISYGQDQAADGSLKRRIVPPEALLSLPLWEGLDGLEIPAGKSVAIDVERGRFAFLGDERPKANGIPVVNYTYAFSDDIGGGPYERIVPSHLGEAGILHVYVAEGCVNEPIEVVPRQWENPGPWFTQARTLAHALAVWEKFYVFCVKNAQGQAPRPTAVIHIVDNGIYGGLDVESRQRLDRAPGAWVAPEHRRCRWRPSRHPHAAYPGDFLRIAFNSRIDCSRTAAALKRVVGPQSDRHSRGPLLR